MSTTAYLPRLAAAVLIAALATAVLVSATPAEAAKQKIDTYKHDKGKLKIKKRGKTQTKRVASNLGVKLASGGTTSPGSVNDLVPGAKIKKLKQKRGKVRTVKLAALEGGAPDCSFDLTEVDGPEEESFECDFSYEDIEQSCSFDQSGESEPGESSKDTSWDCSHSDENLEWDCSYDSSQSSSFESSGGDAEADLSFDCSWDSAVELDAPLWNCELVGDELRFECVADELGQSFGAALAIDDGSVAIDPFADFFRDYEAEEGEDESSCTGSGSSASCSIDGEGTVGGCEVEFSFDSSHEDGFRSGDVSGDMSVDCEYESDDEDEDEEDAADRAEDEREAAEEGEEEDERDDD